jgi:hypothetical protein
MQIAAALSVRRRQIDGASSQFGTLPRTHCRSASGLSNGKFFKRWAVKYRISLACWREDASALLST